MRGLSPEAESVLRYLYENGIADRQRISAALSLTENEVASALDELQITGHAGQADVAFRATPLGQQYAGNLTMDLPPTPPKDPDKLTDWMAGALYEINARTAEHSAQIAALRHAVDVQLDDVQEQLNQLNLLVFGNGNPDEGLVSRAKRTSTYIPILFGIVAIVAIVSVLAILISIGVI